ncbi:MAG: polysaccharide ABC transporter ATP-binding protein [Chloroflexi bacterium]|nr:polysaccharide ABC transporter ATP-binding protein [Chloroflexota bacterium]
MSDTIVQVNDVAKKFSQQLRHVMKYGMIDISRNVVGLSSRPETLRDGEFWAVDGVSFELKRGESLGLIGLNGSGKSTLLKMLNGIYMPDKGSIGVRGRVGALIEVGAGFHPMLTGRENIYVNGSIMGMTKREITEKFEEIVDFADIGEFIDLPVKHYSSGMFVRLGFASAIYTNPDLLLVDEVLAVGDLNFQAKCYGAIEKLRKGGTTVILVSHNPQMVMDVCEKALLLSHGKLLSRGTAWDTLQEYYRMIAVTPVKSENESNGDEILSVHDIEMVDGSRTPTAKIGADNPVTFVTELSAARPVDDVFVNFVIETYDRRTCVHVRLDKETGLVDLSEGRHRLEVAFPNLMLAPGVYKFYFRFLSVGTEENAAHFMKDTQERTFTVDGKTSTMGILATRERWSLDDAVLERAISD